MDIFISYAAPDKAQAEEICKSLERRGYRCWIAPRGVTPGENYGEDVTRAIQRSRFTVVLLSAAANESQSLHREVEHARELGQRLLPVSLDKVRLSPELQYLVGNRAWIDASGPSWLDELQRAIDRSSAVGAAPDIAAAAPPPAQMRIPVPPRIRAGRGPKAKTGRATASPSVDKDKRRATVWFGTNRRPVRSGDRITGFGSERDDTVHFGSCQIAVPESHKIGSLGSPWWKRLLTWRDDRLKVLRVDSYPRERYWREIAQAMTQVTAGERDAIVFIHGYNVSFEGAALRAAQFRVDLGVTGVMAFFSWPSQGQLSSYMADAASIEASEHFIADYLTDIASKTGAERVHIIAHSMGNRGLARAIERIATAAAERAHVRFSQIILAAADIDRDTFRRLAMAYQKVAERTTMYVCSRDRAVEASQWLHEYPRAGLVPPVTVVAGIDTINVSNLDLTGLGHGYVAEARDVLHDIHNLLQTGSPPERRFGLRKASTPEGETYWNVGA